MMQASESLFAPGFLNFFTRHSSNLAVEVDLDATLLEVLDNRIVDISVGGAFAHAENRSLGADREELFRISY